MRSLLTSAMIAALALTANAAMAASPQVHTGTRAVHAAHAPAVGRATVHRRYARAPQYFDVGQFFASILGTGPWPAVSVRLPHYAGKATGGGQYVPIESPTYDTSPPPDYSGEANAAAALAESQAIESMNETMAATASQQAADEENAEANAATLQTEINAGM